MNGIAFHQFYLSLRITIDPINTLHIRCCDLDHIPPHIPIYHRTCKDQRLLCSFTAQRLCQPAPWPILSCIDFQLLTFQTSCIVGIWYMSAASKQVALYAQNVHAFKITPTAFSENDCIVITCTYIVERSQKRLDWIR